ncbi:OmpA family protein [Nitrospira sp. BLG_2]|uniref:OmpA family protein n=1 Tax=Nitrospira sp. BLG_2 TaxID=3397507 RepID=UPI003B9AA0EF
MKTLASLVLVLCSGIGVSLDGALAQAPEIDSIRFSEAALAFSSGAIQKTSPIDGTVNLVTGDNQSTGNRMLLGKRDSLYLKLNNPTEVAVGDLFTVYRRVRKVFHPVTKEYLGFVMNRSAVVKVTAADHTLTTAEAVLSYGPISPGDPVMRFVAPTPDMETSLASNISDLEGMIIELQADRTMTLVSQLNVVYLDRGRDHGLKTGDLLDIHRHSAGLPPRKIGQLRVLSVESHTAAAIVLRANTRVIKGDRFKLVGYIVPLTQPAATTSESPTSHARQTLPNDLVFSTLKIQDASGQSRLNLGDLTKFLHYDSGDAAIKVENYKVLDQLIEYLRTSGDMRMIRIEGHTDNVEIGPSLKSRYPSNWELSKVRSNGVRSYLLEKGGVEPERISSVGLGDTKPIATNTMEEGRTKNRRVEILLYTSDAPTPKSEVQTQVQMLEHNRSSSSAREGNDQTLLPTVSDTVAPSGRGTLSVGDSSQVSMKEESGTASNPDAGATPTAVNKENPSPQQPTTGTPTE